MLFAIINHLSLLLLQKKAAAMSLSTSGVTFQLMDAFDATLTNEQSSIGMIVVLVPFIAAGVTKLAHGGVMHMADRMMAIGNQAANAVGAGTASGNNSIGVTSLDTSSVNNTTMHKHNSDMSLSGGAAQITMSNGNVVTQFSDGSSVLREARNDLRTNFSGDQRYDSSIGKDSHSSFDAGSGSQTHSRAFEAAGSSTGINDDKQRGSDQSSGLYSNSGNNYSDVSSYDNTVTGGTNDRHHSGFNQHANASDSIGGGIRLGGSSGGGRGSNKNFSALQEAGASPEQIAQAKNAHVKQNGDDGEIFGGSFNASSNKIYTAGQEKSMASDVLSSDHEAARKAQTYSVTGDYGQNQNDIERSSQNRREGIDVTNNKGVEYGTAQDAFVRQQVGFGARSSVTESQVYAVSSQFSASPELMVDVANRNGMSANRFFNLNEDIRNSMIGSYLAERDSVVSARTMPTSNYDGKPTLTSASEVNGHYSLKSAAII